MSGRGNTTTSSVKNKSKEKQTTRSGRAGLTFPVGRIVSFYYLFLLAIGTNFYLASLS